MLSLRLPRLSLALYHRRGRRLHRRRRTGAIVSGRPAFSAPLVYSVVEDDEDSGTGTGTDADAGEDAAGRLDAYRVPSLGILAVPTILRGMAAL